MRLSPSAASSARVVNIKDETIVIETGSDRSKIRITRWAVQQNNSAK